MPIQNRIICQHIDNLSYNVHFTQCFLHFNDLAFEYQWIFLNDRGIHKSATANLYSCLLNFIFLMSRHNSEIVGQDQRINGCDA